MKKTRNYQLKSLLLLVLVSGLTGFLFNKVIERKFRAGECIQSIEEPWVTPVVQRVLRVGKKNYLLESIHPHYHNTNYDITTKTFDDVESHYVTCNLDTKVFGENQ